MPWVPSFPGDVQKPECSRSSRKGHPAFPANPAFPEDSAPSCAEGLGLEAPARLVSLPGPVLPNPATAPRHFCATRKTSLAPGESLGLHRGSAGWGVLGRVTVPAGISLGPGRVVGIQPIEQYSIHQARLSTESPSVLVRIQVPMDPVSADTNQNPGDPWDQARLETAHSCPRWTLTSAPRTRGGAEPGIQTGLLIVLP